MENLAKSIEYARLQALKARKPTAILPSNDARVLPLLNQSIYFLNKSKTKYICIGLSPHINFYPIVKVCGVKNQCVLFDENEWDMLLENQGILLNYFHTTDTQWTPMKLGSKVISFQTVEYRKILKIVDAGESEVYLGWESLTELWDLIPLIKYRLNVLGSQGFNEFYSNVINGIVDMPGDFKTNITNILHPLKDTKSENVCCMMEILQFAPEKIGVDIEVASCFKSD